MRKRKYNSVLWKYLSKFEIYDPLHKDFKLYKGKFYLELDRDTKRKKRAEKRSYVVSFPLIKMSLLKRNAKITNLSVPDFIRLTVLTTIQNNKLEQSIPVFKEIQQALDRCVNAIEQIKNSDSGWLRSSRNYDKLISHIEELQSAIQNISK